jgi:hypothetical protein
MKTYNRALDYMALGVAVYRKGGEGAAVKAAKLFAKAAMSPDALHAVAVIEASNKQAVTLQAKAKEDAKAKAKTEAKAKAAQVQATKRLKANEDEIDFDADEVDSLINEGDDAAEVVEDDATDEVVESETFEEEVEDEDQSDEEFDAEFASILASMEPKRSKK